MLDSKETKNQIAAVSEITGLSPFVIEKDLYVTKAIKIVTDISTEYFELIFQGGTSLCKAHRMIERMSEDCDFRIHFKDTEENISKEKKRKSLRNFRHLLIDALKKEGFSIDQKDVRVRNEGEFMAIDAQYPSLYPVTLGLKPYLALEFFLGRVQKPPINKEVTTMIKQFLGDKVDHKSFPVKSISIEETAAEKWVALTRRIATCKHREHYEDLNLVRHLYDLYKICQKGLATSDFIPLALQVIDNDREHYKNHNPDFYHNPGNEIKRALLELEKSDKWKMSWNSFSESMIYEQDKPSYESVINNLKELSDLLMEKID